jgi:hypothetical protein
MYVVLLPVDARRGRRNVRYVQGVLVAVFFIAALASRPIEARLWRAGRISDRTTAVLVLGRFPVLSFLFALIGGASLPLIVGVTALGAIGPVLFYRYMLDLLREQKRAQNKRPAQSRAGLIMSAETPG